MYLKKQLWAQDALRITRAWKNTFKRETFTWKCHRENEQVDLRSPTPSVSVVGARLQRRKDRERRLAEVDQEDTGHCVSDQTDRNDFMKSTMRSISDLLRLVVGDVEGQGTNTLTYVCETPTAG